MAALRMILSYRQHGGDRHGALLRFSFSWQTDTHQASEPAEILAGLVAAQNGQRSGPSHMTANIFAKPWKYCRPGAWLDDAFFILIIRATGTGILALCFYSVIILFPSTVDSRMNVTFHVKVSV